MQRRVFVRQRQLNGETILRTAEVLNEVRGGGLRVKVEGTTSVQTVMEADTMPWRKMGRQDGVSAELPLRAFPQGNCMANSLYAKGE